MRCKLRIFLGLIFFLNVQRAHSNEDGILKDSSLSRSEKQLSESLDFGKAINSLPQLHSSSCCQRSEIVQENLDLDAALERHNISHQQAVPPEPELFIFVSNSMPEQSLRQWASQADKAGGTLVLRGFIDDSPKKTIERVIELFGQNESSGFSIDPERFEQLAINTVPAVAIVLSQDIAHEGEQDHKPLFEVVYGDVPLDEAFSMMIKRGKGRIAEAAKMFLERYRAVL